MDAADPATDPFMSKSQANEPVDTVLPLASPETPTDPDQQATTLGERFRERRLAMALSLEDAAQQVRLPWRVVQKMEEGDWSGIDSPIYLRGYLKTYSSLLGMPPPQMVNEVSHQVCAPQPLVSTGGISRGRYLLQRYAVASTYLVITALIVVPIAVLGVNGGLKSNLARTAPLDPVPVNMAAAVGDASPANRESSTSLERSGREASTLMASMAPVNLIERSLDTRAAAEPSTDRLSLTAATANSHGLAIHLDAPSWVEVTDAEGRRLEYALLQPGDHVYPADTAVTVRLGNAGTAKISLDGETLDLLPYKRSNVAYFQIDAQGTLVKPPDA